jgi:hypothetical protein
MALVAFHGDAVTRNMAIRGLQKCHAAGLLTSGIFHWSGTKGSASGALIQSDDINEWQRQLGLAKWVAFALDATVDAFSPSRTATCATTLLNAIEPGINTEPMGGRVVEKVLSRLMEEATAFDPGPGSAEVLEVGRALQTMHAAAASGSGPDEFAWRAARKSAVQAANASKAAHIYALGTCIEAAAWDTVRASSTVGEVLRVWVNYEHWASVAFGWSLEDDLRMQQLQNEMYKVHIKDKPEETRDIFELLTVHYPTLVERYRLYLKYRNDHRAERHEAAAALLIDALGCGSVPG